MLGIWELEFQPIKLVWGTEFSPQYFPCPTIQWPLCPFIFFPLHPPCYYFLSVPQVHQQPPSSSHCLPRADFSASPSGFAHTDLRLRKHPSPSGLILRCSLSPGLHRESGCVHLLPFAHSPWLQKCLRNVRATLHRILPQRYLSLAPSPNFKRGFSREGEFARCQWSTQTPILLTAGGGGWRCPCKRHQGKCSTATSCTFQTGKEERGIYPRNSSEFMNFLLLPKEQIFLFFDRVGWRY